MVCRISLLFLSAFLGVQGHGCYLCATPESELDPKARLALAAQSDVFFHPLQSRSAACSADLSEALPAALNDVRVDICGSGGGFSGRELCVTLQPNLDNGTFVVRGCLETVLRHHYREDAFLHQPGCYAIRSTPLFIDQPPLDYVLCVCRGNFCNTRGALQKRAAFADDVSRDALRLLDKRRVALLHWNARDESFQLDYPDPEEGNSSARGFTFFLHVFIVFSLLTRLKA